MQDSLSSKILLIGWGTADWQIIKQLERKNDLPNISKLLESGINAQLASLDPPIHRSLWTSINTGKIPTKHGIYTEIEPDSQSKFPSSSRKRCAKFIWEILSEAGLRSHQVAAPVSYPVSKISGTSISDIFYEQTDSKTDIRLISPSEDYQKHIDFKEKAKIKAQQIADEWILNDAIKHSQFASLKSTLFEFLSHSYAVYYSSLDILKTQEWDSFHIFFTKLSEITHVFTRFHLLKNKNIDKQLHRCFQSVLRQSYMLLDSMLGDLLNYIDDNTAILLVSESGYLPYKSYIDNLDLNQSSYEYNSRGTLIMKYPNESKTVERFDVTGLDVVPTTLSLLNQPIAKDMDGNIIINPALFKTRLRATETFESDSIVRMDSSSDPIMNGYAEQLMNLGYPLDNKGDMKDYFVARAMIAAGKQEYALPIMERLYVSYSNNSWIGGRLAGCYLSTNRIKEAEEVLDKVLSIGDGIPELHILRGNLFMMQMKYRSASKQFDIADKNTQKLPNIYSQIGEGYNKMEQWALAGKYFEKEVKVNPSPSSYMALAGTFLQRKMYRKAIDPLEQALVITPFMGGAWFHLGNCQMKMELYEKAAESLENAKKYNRDQRLASQIQQNLVILYKDHLNRQDKLEEMQREFEKSIGSRGTITVVSGLPRSGTSMMMQMLVNGGMEAFTDGSREADDNNKKGYFEHEAIKSLGSNKQILFQIGDKVVKIISHLLQHLPHVFKFKIIFMDRAIEEVMHSQHKMLGRLGKERGEDKENSLALLKPFKESREQAIMWCKRHAKFVDILIVPYDKAVSEPLEQAKRVNEFLGGKLDELKMAAVVDPSLYREKTQDLI